MALDSLNLETSEITAMNEDVARSLVSPRKTFELTAAAGTITDAWNFEEGDAFQGNGFRRQIFRVC
jgi:hypothetical protein